MTEEEHDFGEGWVELPRAEVLERIEKVINVDVVALEVEHAVDPTPVGSVETFTLFMITDAGDQSPCMLMLRDPVNNKARWFLFRDLLDE